MMHFFRWVLSNQYFSLVSRFLASDDSPLLKLQHKVRFLSNVQAEVLIISSSSPLLPPESHLNLLELSEGSDAPDEPEEADEGPGHAHVVKSFCDCLALAPGHFAAVHRLSAVAVILLPGVAHNRVVGGNVQRGAQCGPRVRDTDPGIYFIMR